MENRLLPITISALVTMNVSMLQARTWHVALSRDDGNSGVIQSPLRTIQKATDAAKSGDVILVGKGVYLEEIRLPQPAVTLRALVSSERPRLDGGGTRRCRIYMADGGTLEDVVIEGFEITGQTEARIYAGVGQAKRFVIHNNMIQHGRSQGVWLGDSGHRVERNVIYMMGNDQEARGVLLSANYRTEVSDCIVRGNQIYLCKKEGIRDYGGYDNLIESNIIYGCTYGIALNAARGGTRVLNNYISQVIHGYNLKHATGEHGWNVFWHNTIYDRAYWAVSIGSPPTGDFVDVRNNIFALSRRAQIPRGGIGGFELTFRRNIIYYLEGKAVGSHGSRHCGRDVCAFDRNLHWNASGKAVLFASQSLSEWQATGQDTDSLIADPLFVDPAHDDFRLQPGSPAAKIGFEPWDMSAVGPRPFSVTAR